MILLKILHLPDGHSVETRTASPADLELSQEKEIQEPVHIRYEIEKVGSEFFINTLFETNITMTCDRCAEEYIQEVSDSVRIIFTQDKALLGEDDVYLVTGGTTEVDITNSLRESLLLAIPFKKVCFADCKGLCVTCGANLNFETCTCPQRGTDPRWDQLKKLLNE